MRPHTALCLLATIPALPCPPLAQKHQPKPPFTLVLTAEQPKVSLGADVWAKIVWTNTSKVELNANFYWDSGSGRDYSYTLDFRDSQGQPVAMGPTPPTSSAGFGTLKPGESRNNDVNLSRVFHLTHPGDYTLQVSRYVPKELGGGVIKSNKITITILSPPSPIQRTKSGGTAT